MGTVSLALIKPLCCLTYYIYACRYKLVFFLFTDVDNHKRCVVFGAGLLAKEDMPSYVWLLNNFKCVMGHVHICTVMDQDLAMRIAVPQVLEGTHHRFYI